MTIVRPMSRHAGSLLWLSFFAAIIACWAALWRMAAMAGVDVLGRPIGPMAMMDPRFLPLLGMWLLMMAAMMLPTLVPTLRTYDDLIRSGAGSRGGWVGVALGFLATWGAFAVAIAAAQVQLAGAGVIDGRGAVGSDAAAGALLVAAGLWQFTRVKRICHGVCHSPLGWFLARWRAGTSGGAVMGAGLGLFCVGCCWTYMVLGFAGGVMNLAWMGIATLLMVLEKLPQIGLRVLRPAGALMIAGGIAWGVW